MQRVFRLSSSSVGFPDFQWGSEIVRHWPVVWGVPMGLRRTGAFLYKRAAVPGGVPSPGSVFWQPVLAVSALIFPCDLLKCVVWVLLVHQAPQSCHAAAFHLSVRKVVCTFEGQGPKKQLHPHTKFQSFQMHWKKLSWDHMEYEIMFSWEKYGFVAGDQNGNSFW